MADKRITQLTASSGLVATDILPVVDDPAGTPVTQKATIQQVADAVQAIFDAGLGTYDPAGAATTAANASLPVFDYDAKGKIIVGNSGTPGDYVGLSVGANNTFLVADSASTGGLKYVPIANDQSVLSSQIFG